MSEQTQKYEHFCVKTIWTRIYLLGLKEKESFLFNRTCLVCLLNPSRIS